LVLFSLVSFKCDVGGGRWAPYNRYFSYPAKICPEPPLVSEEFQGKRKLLKTPECKKYIQYGKKFWATLFFRASAMLLKNPGW